MDAISVTLTVYFEDPFWVGVFTQEEKGRLSACKITFGPEPTDAQVYAFVLKESGRLKYSPAVASVQKTLANNKKRRSHQSKKALKAGSTKAREALKKQQESRKTAAKIRAKAKKEQQQKARYEQKRQKKKEKHRGH